MKKALKLNTQGLLKSRLQHLSPLCLPSHRKESEQLTSLPEAQAMTAPLLTLVHTTSPPPEPSLNPALPWSLPGHSLSQGNPVTSRGFLCFGGMRTACLCLEHSAVPFPPLNAQVLELLVIFLTILTISSLESKENTLLANPA